MVLAPYLLGAAEIARELYSSWGRDLGRDLGRDHRDRASSMRSFAEVSSREDETRPRTFFFAGNLNLHDVVGTYSEGVRQVRPCVACGRCSTC